MRRTTSDGEIARITGGVTFPAVFTFEEQLRSLADQVRKDIFKSSPSQAWQPKGFEVRLSATGGVRITHLSHPTWLLDITDRDATFQFDSPEVSGLTEGLRVQTELLVKIIDRLGVDQVRSIGLKVIAMLPMAAPIVDYFGRVLALDPGATILGAADLGQAPLELAFRVAYGLGHGNAALQVSADSMNDVVVVDFDSACTDPFNMPDDHLGFFMDALEHFSNQVSDFLTPVGIGRLPELLPSGGGT